MSHYCGNYTSNYCTFTCNWWLIRWLRNKFLIRRLKWWNHGPIQCNVSEWSERGLKFIFLVKPIKNKSFIFWNKSFIFFKMFQKMFHFFRNVAVFLGNLPFFPRNVAFFYENVSKMGKNRCFSAKIHCFSLFLGQITGSNRRLAAICGHIAGQ